jgi:hypothetical protein
MNEQEILQALQAQLNSSDDWYVRMNALRDWVNANVPDFELYLEDVWNERTEGETHFEYILRSRRTFNETPPLAYDVYKNHQDRNGVWHLDDYQHTVVLMNGVEELVDFIRSDRQIKR